MTTGGNRQLAELNNVTEEIIPYYHELLADIWILGSFPNYIADMLETLPLSPAKARILDLGCGKGPVAITLAQKFGVKVYGCDIYKPFIDEAIKKAREYGVNDLCHFEFANINDVIPKARDYDVVIYAAPGPAFENLEQCVGQLRQTIHQTGYILICDGFAIENKKIDLKGYDYLKGYDGIMTHSESLRQLTSHGDKLLHELIVPKKEVVDTNQRNNEAIAKRAADLAKRIPEMADIFIEFAQKEKDECKIIETTLEEAIWLLQKT